MSINLLTPVTLPVSTWHIWPCERMVLVGSCFADSLGQRFTQQLFRAVVNPFGVMYNPVSIGHTLQRLVQENSLPFAHDEEGVAVFTLGTNHVYILNETGEIVDNCQKRPQHLFSEHKMSISECAESLIESIDGLHLQYPKVNFLITVSPIRYRKYGFHESQLSKSTLLLAVDAVVKHYALLSQSEVHNGWREGQVMYFPSYEIMNDELRDYRFYKPDMLHPSDQAVDYIWECLAKTFFPQDTLKFLRQWEPLYEAIHHHPLHPESPDYKNFVIKTREKLTQFKKVYPQAQLPQF